MKIYAYKNCSSCQKALKYLHSRGVVYRLIPIVEQPPGVAELRRMLEYVRAAGGSLRNLFNTSGVLYRELKVAERLAAGLTEEEALDLLSQHGKLVRRPFLLSQHWGVVGFTAAVWDKLPLGAEC